MILAREKPELRRVFFKMGNIAFLCAVRTRRSQKPTKVAVGGLRNNLSLS